MSVVSRTPEAAQPKRRWLGSTLLLVPIVVTFVVLFGAPMVLELNSSLHPSGAQGLSLDNYRAFLTDAYYLKVLGRTLLIGLATTVFTLLLGYPLAYRMARTGSLRRALATVVVIFPLLVSAVVRTFGWQVLFYRQGPIAALLAHLGLGDVVLQGTATGVVIALTEVLLPFMVLTLLPVMQQINPQWEEAAHDLGAGPFRTFMRVTMPLSVGGILGGSLLVFALSISSFVTPSLLGGDRVQVMATAIYQQSQVPNTPFASAMAIILLAVVLILTIGYSRLLGGARRRSS